MWDTEEIRKALKAWLEPETAFTLDAADEGRFFDFVAAVWRKEHSLWDEAKATDEIVRVGKELHPDWHPEDIQELALDMRSKGTTILCFLHHLRNQGTIGRLTK